MALFKYIISILLFCLYNIAFASDSAVDCVSKKMVAKEVRYSHFWTNLSGNNVLKYNRSNQYSRDLFMLVQKELESAINSCVKTHGITSFLLILHDSQSMKLFSDAKDKSNDIDQLKLSERGKSIFSERYDLLTKYLNSDGILIYAHAAQDKNKYFAASSRYKNFISTPVNTLAKDKLGATYLIKDDAGSFYIWSVDEYSVAEKEESAEEMRMWFGTLDDKEVSKRLVNVESFLKSQGIDIYQYLGFGRSDI